MLWTADYDTLGVGYGSFSQFWYWRVAEFNTKVERKVEHVLHELFRSKEGLLTRSDGCYHFYLADHNQRHAVSFPLQLPPTCHCSMTLTYKIGPNAC